MAATKHKHHIIPKHMGGDDSPDNLTPPISIPLHAALHKDLYEHFGKEEDLFAHNVLVGLNVKGILKHTEEAKRKMSLHQKGRQPRLGAILTQEIKDKISKGKASHFNYIITTPKGEIIKIQNLNKFCRDNGLNQGRMAHVYLGHNKTHKGYKCEQICL